VKEACNGLSVAMSLWAFLIAFRQPLKYYFWVFPIATLALFLANVFRLFALVIIKQNFPTSFVFFHEYLFPGILYLFAFGIMVYWVKLKQPE
jgi:exosortase/archaeosortase family protein